MSIIVNGTSISINGDYIVINGVKVEKVVANGVLVWEKETAIAAQPAPPFTRWASISSGGQASLNRTINQLVLNGGTWSPNQLSITDNKINIYFDLFEGDEDDNLVYSPMFSTGAYSRFEIQANEFFEGMDEIYSVIRYSNDGTNWTAWNYSNNIFHEYKFAQVGIWCYASLGWGDEETGFGLTVTGASFS